MNILKSGITLLLLMTFAMISYAQDNPPTNELVYVTATAWNNDGSKIAAVGLQEESGEGYLQVVDSQTGKIQYQLFPSINALTSVAWSPDDKFLAAGSYDQSIWIVDVQTSTVVTRLRGHQSTVTEVDWSADGKYLVSSGSWDGLTILWDTITYKQIHVVEETSWYTVGTAFSPNDKQIAIVGENGLRVYASTDKVSNKPIWTNEEQFYLGAVAWSHNGNLIAVGSQTFQSIADPNTKTYAQLSIIDTSNGTIATNISTKDDTIFGISWSPDDSLIATYSINGVIRVWESRSGLLLQSFSGTTAYPEKLDFSPFGGRLAYGGSLEISAGAITSIETRADGTQSLAGGAVQIVVPIPSLEKLESITQACVLQSSLEQSLTTQITSDKLQTFTTELSALTDEQIPLGCKADLLAVANALIAKAQ